MNEKITEQLSAMVDDELDQQEQAFFLKRLQQDPEMQTCWGRYMLIGDAMRHNLSKASNPQLLRNISEAIAREPGIHTSAQQVTLAKKVLKPFAGVAVAASVAAMAIIGLQNVGVQQLPTEATPRLAQNSAPVPVQRVSGTRWSMQQPETVRRLNGYLVNHSESTSGISLQGIINYARIAGYDSQQDH